MPYAAHIPEQAAKKRAYDALRYKAKRAERIAQATAHYEANKEKILADRKARYAPSPRVLLTTEERAARKRQSVKAWRAANPDKWKAQTCRAYLKRPDEMVARMRSQRAKRNGAEGTHTLADIKALHILQKGKCVLCLEALGDETPDVDHYIPLSKGGRNDRKNLRLMHVTCNRTKHAKDPVDFGLSRGLLAW